MGAWLVVRRRPGYTETLGLLIPEEAVAGARRLAEETEEVRGRRRAASARAREKAEERYGRQLELWLTWTSHRSTLLWPKGSPGVQLPGRRVVGSGRVGRTRKLALEEEAGLAARVWIRHAAAGFAAHVIGTLLYWGAPGLGSLSGMHRSGARRDAGATVCRGVLPRHQGGRSG